MLFSQQVRVVFYNKSFSGIDAAPVKCVVFLMLRDGRRIHVKSNPMLAYAEKDWNVCSAYDVIHLLVIKLGIEVELLRQLWVIMPVQVDLVIELKVIFSSQICRDLLQTRLCCCHASILPCDSHIVKHFFLDVLF